MNIEAVKDAIRQLPQEERTSLVAWLNVMEYDEWDNRMVKDFSPGGAGMQWVEAAKREIAEGASRPIEEGFALRRKRP